MRGIELSIVFTKMQSLGNDFVVIDATEVAFSLSSVAIQRMAERHLGIGFDQLLVLEPTREACADYYYRIFNADGREVGQCGNGARCIALYTKIMDLINQDKVVLQTSETLISCHIISDSQVLALLEPPKFAYSTIPYDPAQQSTVLSVPFDVVNVGNPHAIIIVDDVRAIDLAAWGADFAKDRRFVEGVNVSVVAIQNPSHISLRVFERGVGKTQACGSAACAAMVLGRKKGLLDSQVIVSQPGGDLEISWQGNDSFVEMAGSAEFVFQGEYFL